MKLYEIKKLMRIGGVAAGSVGLFFIPYGKFSNMILESESRSTEGNLGVGEGTPEQVSEFLDPMLEIEPLEGEAMDDEAEVDIESNLETESQEEETIDDEDGEDLEQDDYEEEEEIEVGPFVKNKSEQESIEHEDIMASGHKKDYTGEDGSGKGKGLQCSVKERMREIRLSNRVIQYCTSSIQISPQISRK